MCEGVSKAGHHFMELGGVRVSVTYEDFRKIIRADRDKNDSLNDSGIEVVARITHKHDCDNCTHERQTQYTVRGK